MKVEVKVIPNSGRFLIKRKDGEVRILLKSKAEANKANVELLKELRKRLKKEVRLISGSRSRKKILEIGIGENEWEEFLRAQQIKS